MEKNKTTVSGGVSVLGLLGVAFVVLKLCKVINWSWWWVTAPFWIPFGVIMLLVVLVGIIAAFTKDE